MTKTFRTAEKRRHDRFSKAPGVWSFANEIFSLFLKIKTKKPTTAGFHSGYMVLLLEIHLKRSHMNFSHLYAQSIIHSDITH